MTGLYPILRFPSPRTIPTYFLSGFQFCLISSPLMPVGVKPHRVDFFTVLSHTGSLIDAGINSRSDKPELKAAPEGGPKPEKPGKIETTACTPGLFLLSIGHHEQADSLSLKELNISNQGDFLDLFLVIAICALVILLLLYNRFLLKKKSHSLLLGAQAEQERTLQQLKEARDQLTHSEKMASLGQLTAGIAHEIQNPLNFVNNFSEGALDLAGEIANAKDEQERKELVAELQMSLEKIHEHGKRAERIVKSMLQHSRQGSGEMEMTDLNHLIHESVNLAYQGIRSTHKDFQCAVEEDLNKGLPQAAILPQDISRVILNIANNAFYAIRERSHAEPGFNGKLIVSTQREGSSAVIRIRDNGYGIPKNIADRIFQPFFTTKPSGQGTGLGLSMSHDIITNIHKGRLSVDSQSGEFTEFTILLPLP